METTIVYWGYIGFRVMSGRIIGVLQDDTRGFRP